MKTEEEIRKYNNKIICPKCKHETTGHGVFDLIGEDLLYETQYDGNTCVKCGCIFSIEITDMERGEIIESHWNESAREILNMNIESWKEWDED